MATPWRTQVKDALLALVAGATFPSAVNGHTTWVEAPSRRLKMFDRIDPSVQPALFIVQHREGYNNRGAGLPPRRWLEIGLWAFAKTGDEGIVGDEFLDSMEEGLEDVLLPPDDFMRNEQTLGGLVYWVKIDKTDGLFIRDPGDIDGQALLVLPVRILMP